MLLKTIEAIAQIVKAEFPAQEVYLQNTGTNFNRPSFLVALVSNLQESLNRWSYQNKMKVNVVYLAPKDENSKIDGLEQLSTIDTLQDLFSCLVIATEDEQLKINQTRIEYTEEQDILLQLELEVTVSRDSKEAFEVMQELNLRRKN